MAWSVECRIIHFNLQRFADIVRVILRHSEVANAAEEDLSFTIYMSYNEVE